MRTTVASLLISLAVVSPALAEEGATVSFGDDVFGAGLSVTLDTQGHDDVFLAGETVTLAAPITGTAHLAGRVVRVEAQAADLYAAGADIRVTAPVSGDATLAGQSVAISASVGADLRAAGETVSLTAPVGQSAILSGAAVAIDAAIVGDLSLAADRVTWGEGARVGGTLTLEGDADTVPDVPSWVVPADRIEIVPFETDAPAYWDHGRDRAWSWIGDALWSVGVLTGLALLLALVMPRHLRRLTDEMTDRPWRAFWTGTVSESALVGLVILLTLSLVGILAVPLVILAALLVAGLGYLIGVFALGQWMTALLGELPPETLGEKALAAALGAVAITVAAWVPVIGWLIGLGLCLAGVGAMTRAWVLGRA